MRNFVNYCLFSILFLIISGCTNKIDGEVFIVTKGGDSIKLALVDIYAYKVKDIEAFKKSIHDNLSVVIKSSATTEPIVKSVEYSTQSSLKAMQNDQFKYIIRAIKLSTVGIEPITAQSDADGKFKLELSSGEYVIVAVGNRQALDENYLWLMLGTKNGQLRMANDSEFNKGCVNCLFSLKEVGELQSATVAVKNEIRKAKEAAERDESAIDPDERKSYDQKSCSELKNMAILFPNSVYSARIESYILKKWKSSVCQ